MKDDMPQVKWVHPDTESVGLLREAEPGIYHVSTELMHQMMRELGWKPEDEVQEAP